MISIDDMRKLEQDSKLSSLDLMENAGFEAFKVISEKFNDFKVLVVCYHGNNGGDGFVIARYLYETGYKVDVLFIGSENKLTNEAKENYEKLKKFVLINTDYKSIKYDSYEMIIDAMLGTGIKSELKSPLSEVVSLLNNSKANKVAIDVPTGINPDTGKLCGESFNFDLIICFHDIKKGLVEFKDKVEVVDIGVESE